MSSAGPPTAALRRARAIDRALAKALGCAAALCIALLLFGHERAEAAATVSSALEVGASISIRCTIITVPLSFGNYTVTDPTPLDMSGAVSLNCAPSRFVTRIRLDQGLYPASGSSNPNPSRQMSNGAADRLGYNIYRDAARTQVWGNTNPTGVIANGPYPMLIPVYGRIPALQSVQPGAYADTVQLTVLF
jgi:spore coat protein U-like protein